MSKCALFRLLHFLTSCVNLEFQGVWPQKSKYHKNWMFYPACRYSRPTSLQTLSDFLTQTQDEVENDIFSVATVVTIAIIQIIKELQTNSKTNVEIIV